MRVGVEVLLQTCRHVMPAVSLLVSEEPRPSCLAVLPRLRSSCALLNQSPEYCCILQLKHTAAASKSRPSARGYLGRWCP